jgi:predicted transcriptional regulator
MKITERDIAIIRFINQFGFCATHHLSQQFALSLKRVNKITKRLADKGFLLKERMFYGQHALCRVTDKGAQFSTLPPLSKISVGTYHHNIALINLYIKIATQYPNAEWISERTLLYEKYVDGVGKFGHCADALLLFPDNKDIAIEVELTSKSKRRLESIVKSYSTNLLIDEVWYFCSETVLPAVKKVASHLNYVRIFNLSEFLSEVT